MRRILLVILVLLCAVGSYAQPTISILDRKIDISFTNEKTITVLNRISALGNFSFSYNSSIISPDDVVSIEGKNTTVREILNEIFRGSVTYKEKGNHIILTKVSLKPSKTNKISMIINGYVEDFFTKEKIVDASVYDKSSLASTVTDEFGFFRLKLDKRTEESLSVSISKKDYIDETLVITESGNQYFHVVLKRVRPLSASAPESPADTTDLTTAAVSDTAIAEIPVEVPGEKETDEVLLPYTSSPNVENISDTLYRDIQISLLPFVGSNGSMSGNIINEYSINIFGGYSMGTRQIELGFFFNFDRGDARWLQVAGFGNVNGGSMYGVQGAGFFNLNGGETKAAQGSGFANINFKDFQGVQVSGMANVNLRSADGVLVAGSTNFSRGNSVGVQVAGFNNVHIGDYKGPQIAGFANVVTGKIVGSQVSAFYNHAHEVHGTQVGFFNYADSLTGVPIGFLSMVKHGYHKLELSADEVFYGNLSFRTGVKQFYNILQVGIKPENVMNNNTENVWSFGYGIGAAKKVFRWMDINVDVVSQHVNKGGFTADLSSLNRLNAGFDFKLARKVSIYAGGTLNMYLSHPENLDTPVLFTDFKPNVFHDETFARGAEKDVNMKLWFGAKVGLRFF